MRDHILTEEVASEDSARRRAAQLEKQLALAVVLEQVAKGETADVPPILEDLFDIAALKQAVAVHRAEVDAANEYHKKQSPIALPVALHWPGFAEALMARRTAGQLLYERPTTPWDRIRGKLIGKCQVPGVDESFIREWIAREVEYDESDTRTAELARLDRDGVQRELLVDLRRIFPSKADEWFGPSAHARNPTPETVQAGGSTHEAGLDAMLAIVEAVVDENALAIIQVARNSEMTVDERMRRIYAIDNRSVGWTSSKWASVLTVSDSAVRQTDWWRIERKRLTD